MDFFSGISINIVNCSVDEQWIVNCYCYVFSRGHGIGTVDGADVSIELKYRCQVNTTVTIAEVANLVLAIQQFQIMSGMICVSLLIANRLTMLIKK